MFDLVDKMMQIVVIEWHTYNAFGEKLNEKKQNVQTVNYKIIVTF
jgi:hypothetical protein